MDRLFAAFSLVMFVSACAPSEQAIQTALAKTQEAAPTNTSTAVPPTKTPTATVTPSPTPDVRVITADPKEFLLDADDLPREGKYYLPNANWKTPHRNSEILNAWGAEKGGKYINETGRVDGWIVAYKRGSSKVPLPDEVYDNVVLYQTAKGAQYSITKYGDTNLSPDFVEIQSPPAVGDLSRAFLLKKGNTSEYLYYFSYRNYLHVLDIYGLESEVNPKFVEQIAKKLLAKLEDAQLSNSQ